MTATVHPHHATVVETLYPDWVKINTYDHGRLDGSYEVFGESATSVRFTRIGDPERYHTVRCAGGVPVACTCKGHQFGGRCKHKTILAGMLKRGRFVLPAVDPNDDRPDGWLYTTEVE